MSVSGMKPRTVEDVNLPITGTEYHYKRISGGAPVTVYNGVATIAKDSSYVAGFDILGYHKRKRAGELLPFTPWEKFTKRVTWTGRLQYSHAGSSTIWYTDSNWSHPTSLVPWDPTLTDMRNATSGYDTRPYIQAAASSIYSQGFDAFTFLAEFRKTVAMFSQAVGRLRAMEDTFQQWYRKVGSKTHPAIALGNFWLEYRYGWRTLWYDMVDIAEALTGLNQGRTRFKQRAGKSTKTAKSVDYTYAGTFGFTVTAVDEVNTSLRGNVVADIDPPEFQFNPLTTSWELVRFSFIIDWFLGIGQWLATLSFLFFETDYAAAGGLYYTVKRTWSITNTTASPGYVVNIAQTSGQLDMVYRIRTPQAVPNFPLFNVRLDIPKVADLLAIIWQCVQGFDKNLARSTRL